MTLNRTAGSARESLKGKKILCEAMIDTGATSTFISKDFAKRHRLLLKDLPRPRALEIADGRKGFLAHFVELDLTVDDHKELLTCYMAPKLNYPLILGLPWLSRH